MNHILTLEQVNKEIETIRSDNQRIVVVGGCFDIIHSGHVRFLEAAKKEGDVLMVLLESDTNVKRYKGENRPVHLQDDRAFVLSALRPVDYVVLLPPMTSDNSYDNVLMSIKPAIIATTKGDPGRRHKIRQAELSGSSLKEVLEQLPQKSTSRIFETLIKETL